MITITAFIGSALVFSGLILAGIAGWVIEIICYWQEARENREEAKKVRVAIGKRREYKPCVQKVERTACKD